MRGRTVPTTRTAATDWHGRQGSDNGAIQAGRARGGERLRAVVRRNMCPARWTILRSRWRSWVGGGGRSEPSPEEMRWDLRPADGGSHAVDSGKYPHRQVLSSCKYGEPRRVSVTRCGERWRCEPVSKRITDRRDPSLADGRTLDYDETVDPTIVDAIGGSELVVACGLGGWHRGDRRQRSDRAGMEPVHSQRHRCFREPGRTHADRHQRSERQQQSHCLLRSGDHLGTLFLPGGLVFDQNGDANPTASIAVIPAPGTAALLDLAGLAAARRRH